MLRVDQQEALTVTYICNPKTELRPSVSQPLTVLFLLYKLLNIKAGRACTGWGY